MKIKLLYVNLFIVLLLYSCKKYENGPLISLKSPEKRLLGKWEIEEVKKDGNVVTDFDSLKIDYYYFKITENPNIIEDVTILERAGSNITNGGLIFWQFLDNEKVLNLLNSDQGTPSYLYPLPTMIANNEKWDIKKLSSSRMWLEINVVQGIIEIKFKKLKE